MLDILNNSAAKSGLISFKAPFILARNFATNFATKWMHKDVGLALESGKSHGCSSSGYGADRADASRCYRQRLG